MFRVSGPGWVEPRPPPMHGDWAMYRSGRRDVVAVVWLPGSPLEFDKPPVTEESYFTLSIAVTRSFSVLRPLAYGKIGKQPLGQPGGDGRDDSPASAVSYVSNKPLRTLSCTLSTEKQNWGIFKCAEHAWFRPET